MVLSHGGYIAACDKTIGQVSQPCTRSQFRPGTLSTVGVLNYVLMHLMAAFEERV